MLIDNIRFPNRQALMIKVTTKTDIGQALISLGFHQPRPAIVIIGGAEGINPGEWEAIHQANEIIGKVAEGLGAAVIDGGTDSGVMAAIGQLRAKHKYHFPLIGVVAEETVTWPGKKRRLFDRITQRGRVQLEPHHTHFVLVPGKNRGDESAWIAETASQIAGTLPSLAILLNGGQISKEQDVPNNLQTGRPVYIIAGTGRAADEFAAMPPGSRQISIVSLKDPAALESDLQTALQKNG